LTLLEEKRNITSVYAYFPVIDEILDLIA